MIPLFCLPVLEKGTSSGKCIQGSVKGPGAVGNLVPRLKQLLASGTTGIREGHGAKHDPGASYSVPGTAGTAGAAS